MYANAISSWSEAGLAATGEDRDFSGLADHLGGKRGESSPSISERKLETLEIPRILISG